MIAHDDQCVASANACYRPCIGQATATTAIQGTAITAIKTTALTTATKGTTATTKGTATAITGHRKNARYLRDAANKWLLVQKLPLFELARVLVRFNHGTRCIVNPNHSVM